MEKGKDNSRKLILFTSDFPFGTGETFLETEILYLCKGFDEVQIFSSSQSNEQTRDVPDNCRVERLDLKVTPSQKLFSLIYLLHPLFWNELQIIRKIYKKKLTKGITSTMLISIYRANKIKKIANNLIKESQDISNLVFYSYWCDDVALGLALLQRKNKNIKCISRIHGWDVYFEASNLNYLPFRHAIAQGLRKIFAISQKGADYTRTTWKVDSPDKVVVSRLGVQEQSIMQPETTPFVLVSCSNVISLKRVDLIAKALKNIRDNKIHWVHFGDGPQLEMVKQLTQEFPSNINAEFKGQVSNNVVLNWYRVFKPHLFINVSTTEGIPVSIMEAMSFGIPVIATNVGGTREIVNEENGILLRTDPSPSEIAENITKMIVQNEVFNQKKQAAINSWKQNFNADKNYTSFVQNLLNL